MKRLTILLASVVLTANIFAAGTGFVDTQQIIAKYPETQRTQTFLEGKKADLQKMLDEEKKKIEAKDKDLEKKGDKATEKEKKELDKMKEDFKEKYQGMQQNLDQLQYTMFEKLKSDINLAIKEVASKKKLDMVFDKQVVYYGGTDVTDEVLKFLAGVEKIDIK